MKKIRRRRPIKRPHYRLSNEDKKTLIKMYLAGMHPVEMADELRISHKTSYKFCSDMFSPSAEGGWTKGAPSERERIEVMGQFFAGNSIKEIAEAYKRPYWVIQRIVNPKPAGIAAIDGAPIAPNPVGVVDPSVKPGSITEVHAPELGVFAKAGRFVRRLFGGSN